MYEKNLSRLHATGAIAVVAVAAGGAGSGAGAGASSSSSSSSPSLFESTLAAASAAAVAKQDKILVEMSKVIVHGPLPADAGRVHQAGAARA